MVQQFTPDAADETLAYGLGRFHRRMDHINAAAFGDALKLRAKLAIVVADEKAQAFNKRRGFAQLLGHPRITR